MERLEPRAASAYVVTSKGQVQIRERSVRQEKENQNGETDV
jgi:hypothetical protein